MHERFPVFVIGALSAAVFTFGCVADVPDAVLERSERFDSVIELPPPDLDGQVSLERVLAERRSVREFADTELPLETVAQLFWAGQGITNEVGYRTAPSAGARYPLELYALSEHNVMRYLPDGHRAERADSTALGELSDAAFDQEFVGSAPVVLIVVGVVARTEVEYGALAERLVDREAGHAVQNVLLQATALGLSATPVGGFDPDTVARLLTLPPGHEVLYLVPVGA